MATVLGSVTEQIEIAAKLLRAGSCVAFPTETVYGLGANALDVAAVLRVFEFKGRPLTDPLIVHVPDADAAAACVSIPMNAAQVFRVLTSRFWPGPLTLVCKAQAHIPPEISARTGWVGVRVPAHPVALALLRAAGVPVAAPSANRFGHVSPTRAEHVLADLGQHPIAVIRVDDDGTAPCSVGIESTVVKLWGDGVDGEGGRVRLTVLRRGGVSVEEIEAVLAEAGQMVAVDVLPLHAPAVPTVPSPNDLSSSTLSAVGDEAPGMAVTHYAPDMEAMLVTTPSVFSAQPDEMSYAVTLPCPLHAALILDFGGALLHLQDAATCLGYRDLSASGDVFEARARVFDYLRWTESVPGAQLVLLADPLMRATLGSAEAGHAEAIRDRMFRAASGRLLNASALE